MEQSLKMKQLLVLVVVMTLEMELIMEMICNKVPSKNNTKTKSLTTNGMEKITNYLKIVITLILKTILFIVKMDKDPWTSLSMPLIISGKMIS